MGSHMGVLKVHPSFKIYSEYLLWNKFLKMGWQAFNICWLTEDTVFYTENWRSSFLEWLE